MYAVDTCPSQVGGMAASRNSFESQISVVPTVTVNCPEASTSIVSGFPADAETRPADHPWKVAAEGSDQVHRRSGFPLPTYSP